MADEKKKTKEVIKVLELEGHLITVDSRNWILDGNSFYPNLEGALKELSQRILKEKLKGRPDKDIVKLDALIRTIEFHNEWFREVTQGI